MALRAQFIIGTSGYSFADWVGTFYPPDVTRRDMFAHYARAFSAVELNFTYYRMPTARTLEALARKSPAGFTFWVKANQELTHKGNRSISGEFIEGLSPLRDARKLAGVLMQFPQSFHRTGENRKYLAAAIDDFSSLPLAVEFRHASWQTEATLAGLRERNVTLAVPDVPDIASLFHSPAAATTNTGYLRLHSRDASKWYAGGSDRYDYGYSPEELKEIAAEWAELDEPLDKIYAFFNNCHGGQAAQNAQEFQRIIESL
jgi:uncharacterized protein YecE (DUF72 family)